MIAAEFWDWFARNSNRLRSSGPEAAADELEVQIRSLDPRLGVEVSGDGGERDITVTAGGDPSVFDVARRVANAAPVLIGWRVQALKPPRGFEFRLSAGGLEIDAHELRFDPVRVKGQPDQLAVRVYAGARLGACEGIADAVRLVLEAGIGEELSARIKHVEVAPAPDSGAPLPITDLAAFVAWHLRHQPEREPNASGSEKRV